MKGTTRYGYSTGAFNSYGVYGQADSAWASSAGVYGIGNSGGYGVLGRSMTGIFGYFQSAFLSSQPTLETQ